VVTGEQDRLLAVRAAVQRYVAGRTDEDREDVVQEAMTRLLENRTRLEPDAWLSYAVVSAGNLLADRARVGSVARRHQHRLYQPDVQPGPEERVLTTEEHAAVQRAMAALEETDASLLAEHYSRVEPSRRSMAPATAARLSRARAKLRVAYVLEHGRRPLPTPRCRPVLEALSTGDQRRQQRLGTARHLLACRACAGYAPALVERRRSLAGLAPLGWIAVALGSLWSAVRRHPGRSASASTAPSRVAVACAGTARAAGRRSAAADGSAPADPVAASPRRPRPVRAVLAGRRGPVGPGALGRRSLCRPALARRGSAAGAGGRGRRGLLGRHRPGSPGLAAAGRRGRVAGPGAGRRPVSFQGRGGAPAAGRSWPSWGSLPPRAARSSSRRAATCGCDRSDLVVLPG
jgi:RNA polymerase sigma factor (sigma-70 family)